ncbi:MAG: hypothetical protein ACM3XM_19095 [Mycobacterium leprae]
MKDGIYTSVALDLEAWDPTLPADRRSQVAERIARRLEGRDGRAEHTTQIGDTILWLYDAKSSRLLATYPTGANRIRSI